MKPLDNMLAAIEAKDKAIAQTQVQATLQDHDQATTQAPALADQPVNRYLAVKQVAKMLGIAVRTLQTRRSQGKFPGPDLKEGSVIRWKQSTVDHWLNTHMRK